MKKNIVISRLFIIGLFTVNLVSIAPVWANDGKEEAHEHEASGSMHKMHTTEELLKMIEEAHQKLTLTVTDKKLSEVHEQAFLIRDLAKELITHVAADKKAKVTASASNISKLADELDKTGDAGNQAATEANLKKLDGVLKLLSSQAS